MSNITKRALAESLKNLLLKKPLNKITINDLTTDCGISRMAFYYHFKDIYDLVEWACLEESRKALQGKKTYDTWQEGLLTNEQKNFIADFYKYSFVGIMLDWIRQGIRSDYASICDNMCITIHGNITNSIQNFTKHAK